MSHNSDIDWIEEAVTKKYFKHYEYKDFSNIQEIGSGGFGKVFRANWKRTEQYLALKTFYNAIVKEIVREVITCIFILYCLILIYIFMF